MNTKTTARTPQDEALARIAAQAEEMARTTPNSKGRGRKGTPKACACGCGGMTRGGCWMPGHDAKMLSRLLAEARARNAAATHAA